MSITQGAIYSSPSSQDPSGQVGFAGSGSLWLQTDTYNMYVRDATNTSWVLLGITNTQNLGLAPKSGFAATGAITGATGLMTDDGSTPFASAPVVTGANSSNLATLNDLANLQNNLYNLVNSTVQQAMTGIPTAGISANMAFSKGIYTVPPAVTTFQIPLPVYSDGTTASIADCLGKYTVGITGFSYNQENGNGHIIYMDETAPNTMNYTITITNTTFLFLRISYLAIAIKPGS